MNIQIISASAGSGKTYRLAELLEQVVKDGSVRPDAIVATTFTIKAAAELQERVRTRLLGAGLATQAQQLSASRIGTVNSVCGGLLTDFALDLGISPDQKVIEEEAVSGLINRAMARVVDAKISKELWFLEQCFQEIDCRKIIQTIIAKARANCLGYEEIVQCGIRSAEEYLQLFCDPAPQENNFYMNLQAGMESFLAQVDIEIDGTKKTKNAILKVQQLKTRLSHQKYLPWCDWLSLTKLDLGAKSKEAGASLLCAASCHDKHPQLQKDAERLIRLNFEVAAKTLVEYQKYKRRWGVVDFIDQEALTLRLLEEEGPAQIIRERLDLVLIDEFQDTSPIQLAIFLKLAALAKKSVWVGDQKQAIYGFRDTDPSLMDAAIAAILQEEEPETLHYSWRSRPELVSSTSDIFVKAFAEQGFPEQRVRLESAPDVAKKTPKGLSPVYECWQLASKNQSDDALALASAASNFLADKKNTIRDRKTGSKRQAKGGDIAILCRTNDICRSVAEALEQQGIRAALPRPGLLSCPEIILTLAAVRLTVDLKDSLARAEIARLLDSPDDHNGWLNKALMQKYAEQFDLPIFERIDAARENLKIAGPLEVLDAAMKLAEIRTYCLAWGEAEERLANLDSLRSLSAAYVENCRSTGRGASSADLLTHLDSMETDTKAVVQNEDTVQVLTWHKAKGLEWPVTVLFQLDKVFPALPLGVNIVSDSEFDFNNPLANRWMRFWPAPYGKFTTGAPFHERLADHPATQKHMEKEERQELRLLYVGWTRARDKVVLAGRSGFLQKGILRLLKDGEGEHLLEYPESNIALWAGKEIKVAQRIGMPEDPVAKMSKPGTGYRSGEEKMYPPAFQAASSIAEIGNVLVMEKLGVRFPLTGKPDMQLLGEAIHVFLGADNVKREREKRLEMADKVLHRWRSAAHFSAESLVQAGERLHSFILSKWPDAIWHREYPVFLRQDNGTIISGFIDLLLETQNGFIILDHKSFPGSVDEAQERAAGFAGQLRVYADAVKEATGKGIMGCFIHLPILGLVASVEICRASNMDTAFAQETLNLN